MSTDCTSGSASTSTRSGCCETRTRSQDLRPGRTGGEFRLRNATRFALYEQREDGTWAETVDHAAKAWRFGSRPADRASTAADRASDRAHDPAARDRPSDRARGHGAAARRRRPPTPSDPSVATVAATLERIAAEMDEIETRRSARCRRARRPRDARPASRRRAGPARRHGPQRSNGFWTNFSTTSASCELVLGRSGQHGSTAPVARGARAGRGVPGRDRSRRRSVAWVRCAGRRRSPRMAWPPRRRRVDARRDRRSCAGSMT